MRTTCTRGGIWGWYAAVSLYPWRKHSIHSLLQLLSQSAKKTEPRGCRQQYIPTWNDECNHDYKEFVQTEDKQSTDAKAADLMDHLNKNCNKRWQEIVKEIDFTHSSRKAWKTFNRLTGRKFDSKQCPITANLIAKQLLGSGHFKEADRRHDLSIKRQCSMIWRVPGVGGHLTTPFTTTELRATIKTTERWESPRSRQHPIRVHDALR